MDNTNIGYSNGQPSAGIYGLAAAAGAAGAIGIIFALIIMLIILMIFAYAVYYFFNRQFPGMNYNYWMIFLIVIVAFIIAGIIEALLLTGLAKC